MSKLTLYICISRFLKVWTGEGEAEHCLPVKRCVQRYPRPFPLIFNRTEDNWPKVGDVESCLEYRQTGFRWNPF